MWLVGGPGFYTDRLGGHAEADGVLVVVDGLDTGNRSTTVGAFAPVNTIRLNSPTGTAAQFDDYVDRVQLVVQICGGPADLHVAAQIRG
ncbi:MAG TPA: hypothetical protein VFW65_00500 [Pseudonocardiaceae bacterium]|nr:hypothetical protein [Pseudonocardiaceae bacterium]